jgi:hypothetical protein
MVFRWRDKRSDAERGRKRRTRRKQKCAMPGCRKQAQYGWACGFCNDHAITRGCHKPEKKSEAKHAVKSAGKLDNNTAARNVEKRPAEAEVSKPWWLDEATELEDHEAYEDDYEEVLHCLGTKSDDVSVLRICNLNCWLVGDDDEEEFCVHQWEAAIKPRGPKRYRKDGVPADVVEATSQDWLWAMDIGSIKKMWWQKMHLRRLRQKTTVPNYDVFSEICRLQPDAMSDE